MLNCSTNRSPRVAVSVATSDAKVATVEAFLSSASVLAASDATILHVVSRSASTVSGLGCGSTTLTSADGTSARRRGGSNSVAIREGRIGHGLGSRIVELSSASRSESSTIPERSTVGSSAADINEELDCESHSEK